MFSEYEDYCAERLNNYDASLSAIIKSGNAKSLSLVGFSDDDKQVQKNFMLKTLRLQLLSENYTNLRDESVYWIEENDKGVSTFNVFLLGNIRQIESAITGWERQLDLFSAKILSNEDDANALVGGPKPVKFSQFQSSHDLNSVFTKLDRLTASFTTTDTWGSSPSCLPCCSILPCYCPISCKIGTLKAESACSENLKSFPMMFMSVGVTMSMMTCPHSQLISFNLKYEQI